MSLQPGDHLGPYEILSTIGSGGMGVVYRGRDTKLGRSVAIKLTSRSSLDDTGRHRLLREAQHASALNHPNICTVYELGETDGQPYIVMEYVDGQPLTALIPSEGLPVDRVVRYGGQIAEALDHAHAQGVIHRDLKAANVVISGDGRAKVLDFGLAQRTWHDGAAYSATVPQTRSDTVAGTIAYMAPEVLQGRGADTHSDIWALGVLLYEMSAGKLPFDGRTAFELSSCILREPPRALPTGVSPALSDVILRCLAKNPAQRFSRSAEVAAALQAIDAGGVHPTVAHVRRLAARIPVRLAIGGTALALVLLLVIRFATGRGTSVTSLAVVPFLGDAASTDTEYLNDGVTEGVIDRLARLRQPGLKVIALNSVQKYKGRDVDPETVGRELNVGAVVLGRVVHRADALSVRTELIDARDRSQMWGETYNATLSDLPTVQQEIADKISRNLHLPVNDADAGRASRQETANVEAYRLYLKGRYFWNKYTEDGWKQALKYFGQAIELDPNYALAWAGLADSYYQLSSLVLVPGEAIPAARAAAARALAIDDRVAEAHASLGMIKAQYDWDPRAAEKEFKRAIDLNPSYATAHQWYGMHLYANGSFETALGELTKAQQLDPLSMFVSVTAVWPLLHLGRDDEAIRQLERIIELFPNVPDVVAYLHEVRGQVHMRNRRYDEAIAEFVHGFRTQMLCGDGPEPIERLLSAYHSGGLDGYWHTQLELAVAWYQQQVKDARAQSVLRYVSPFRLAELYARLGDTERAFELLADAFKNRDENMRWLKVESLLVDSPWQSLRPDPRFAEMIRGVGLDE